MPCAFSPVTTAHAVHIASPLLLCGDAKGILCYLLRKGVQELQACGKNPACLRVQSWTWWTVLPLKRGTWGTSRQPPWWVRAALPACPLYWSFEPINTITLLATTSYLQENEQTSRRTEVPTCLESPEPRIWGLTFEMEKMSWQWL